VPKYGARCSTEGNSQTVGRIVDEIAGRCGERYGVNLARMRQQEGEDDLEGGKII
jgi:hypothetical protein